MTSAVALPTLRSEPLRLGNVLPVAFEVARLGLGVVFLWSGFVKLAAPYGFMSSVAGYELTGHALAVTAASALPWVEIVLGLCLLVGVAVGGALAGSAALGIVFTAATLSVIVRGVEVDCGCFGSGTGQQVGWATALRSGAVAVAAAAGAVLLIRRSMNAWGRAYSPAAT